jgi:cold shock protein
MPTGTVKFCNDLKGYGFIARGGGGNDIFVHASALERAGLYSLAEGQTTWNQIARPARCAANVQKA